MDEMVEMTHADDEVVGDESPVGQIDQSDPVEEVSSEPEAGEREAGKSSREVARLINVIKNLQVENTRLKDVQDTEPSAEATVHPALQGLETDENGKVLYHGSYVAPEFAVEHYEQSQKLGQLEEALRVREETERTARLDAAKGELFGVVQSAIVEMREASLPGLDKGHASLADEYILSQADYVIARALASGEALTPELIERAGRESLSKAKQLFGVFGERQIRDNQEYADTYRVKPDGLPGTRMPTDEARLTKAERIRLAQERTRLAMAMRSSG